MSQTLIDALDALESQIATLTKAVKSADPAKIGQMAEQGATRGSSATLNKLSETTRALQTVTADLQRWALPAAQKAQEVEKRYRWGKIALIVLLALLCLLAAFGSGAYLVHSNLKENTPESCASLGGSWSVGTDGKHVCARWER